MTGYIREFAIQDLAIGISLLNITVSLVPIFTPFLDDELKVRITRHAKKQVTIGGNLKSITVGGVQIFNWTNSTLDTTLHWQLMCIESITDKEVLWHDSETEAITFK